MRIVTRQTIPPYQMTMLVVGRWRPAYRWVNRLSLWLTHRVLRSHREVVIIDRSWLLTIGASWLVKNVREYS